MTRYSVVWVDMHARDIRVLEFLKSCDGQPVKQGDIADEIGCHVNTAAAILKRLSGAGCIEIDKQGTKRGGYVVRVLNVRT
jgi:DNA-binding MarR family transcriptional regulator